MRVRVFLLYAMAVLIGSYSASVAQQRPHVTGFFSNMRYVPGPGDVIGSEVWIVNARGTYYVTFQDAEGSPERPVVVPAEVSGSHVRFTVHKPIMNGDGTPAPNLVLRFDGEVTVKGLVGRFDGGEVMVLPRRQSFWQ